MSRTLSRRVLAQSPFASISESAHVHTLPLQCFRPFSVTPDQKAEGDGKGKSTAYSNYVPHNVSTLRGSAGLVARARAAKSASLNPNATTSAAAEGDIAHVFQGFMKQNQSERNLQPPPTVNLIPERDVEDEPHHFHVYATRHNTHITLTRPNREPIISLSCGNIGFRHSGRKHYDSAFQLASLVMTRIHERAIGRDIKGLELVLRGFGAGREAVTKALLGTEGRWLRGKVVKVTDATRLKFGGTRSKKPRRLG